MHQKRRWIVSAVRGPEDLAKLLTDYTWTLCSGFAVAGHSHEPPPPAMRITSMPVDPLAPDWGERLNRLKPQDLYGQEGIAFTHGIVAEILACLPDGRTRNVSLYLNSPESRHIYLGPNDIAEFVDFHASEFTLYKRATEMGYLPTDPDTSPPNDV